MKQTTINLCSNHNIYESEVVSMISIKFFSTALSNYQSWSVYHEFSWIHLVCIKFVWQIFFRRCWEKKFDPEARSFTDQSFPWFVYVISGVVQLLECPKRKFDYHDLLTPVFSYHQVEIGTEHIFRGLGVFIFVYQYWDYICRQLDRIRCH